MLDEGGARGWASIVGFFANYLLIFGFLRSLSVLVLPMMNNYNISIVSASSLPGIICIGISMGMAAGPTLVRLLGIRASSYLFGLLPTACWLTMYVWYEFTVFLFSFTVIAFSWGVIFILCMNCMTIHYNANRTLATQIGTLGTSFGQAIFPVLIAFFIQNYAFRGLLLIMAGIFGNHVAGSMLFMPKVDAPVGAIDKEVTELANRIDSDDTNTDCDGTRPILRTKSLFKTFTYWIYVAQQMTLNVGVNCGMLYTASHIVTVCNVTEVEAAFLISIQGAIEAAIRIPFGFIGDRECINKMYLISFISFNMGLSYLLVGLASSYYVMAIGIAYGGLFTGGFGGLSLTALGEVTDKFNRNDELLNGIGVSMTINSLLTIGFALLCGQLTQVYGNYLPSFFISTALLMMSAILCGLMQLCLNAETK